MTGITSHVSELKRVNVNLAILIEQIKFIQVQITELKVAIDGNEKKENSQTSN